MNKFAVFFLIVSIFACSADCMNPSDLGLPRPKPPKNVEFGECFVVPKIAKGILSTELYSYNHICPKKIPSGGSQPSENENIWYFVGSFKGSETLAKEMSKFDYIPIGQSLIRFTYLKDTLAKFMLRYTNKEFEITFQSLEQSQAFYGIIYQDVALSLVARRKIFVLHEMNSPGSTNIGDNVQAVYEDIEGTIYITFKNGQGAPILIFNQNDASIERIRRAQKDKLQLTLRINEKHYLSTFLSNNDARDFGESLAQYIKKI